MVAHYREENGKFIRYVTEGELEFAEMLASRLEKASENSAWVHETKGLASAIRDNVAIFRGEMRIPPTTSLGKPDFFIIQQNMALRTLANCATSTFRYSHLLREGD